MQYPRSLGKLNVNNPVQTPGLLRNWFPVQMFVGNTFWSNDAGNRLLLTRTKQSVSALVATQLPSTRHL